MRSPSRLLSATLVLAISLPACTTTEEPSDSASTGDTGSPTDTETPTPTDTPPSSGPLAVYGFNNEYVPPGGDYFDITADGIAPFSDSRHSLQIVNESDERVTIGSVDATPTQGVLDSEWSLVDPSESVPTPMDLTDVTLAPGETLAFDIVFVPIESGLRVEDVVVTYDGDETYPFTLTGRGRDAFRLFAHGENSVEKVVGSPSEDTETGASVLDEDGNLYASGNGNGWQDAFSENIVLTRMDADGSLGWIREWAESYEQLSPDPGQNAESGGGADSVAYADGQVYVAGRRSQSSLNSAFQALVFQVDAATGDLGWAVGFSPDDVSPPSVAWQSAQAYAVDASLPDRVIVTGTSYGEAEVLLVALAKSDGRLLWSRQLEVADGYNDRGYALRVAADGSAWIGGLTNGRGLLARVTGVSGSSPALDFVKQLDMGTGGNVNSIDVDAAGNAYLSLDRRGAITSLGAARFDTDGSLAWAKTWNEDNVNDNDNTYVVRVDQGTDTVYVGGRVAVDTADTQYGDGFLMRLDTDDGAYDWGAMYYTGKGAEEMVENRVKGVAVDGAGDLRILVQSYTNSLDFAHYWGYWYELSDDPLADLTAGEDPGDGGALLVDYSPTISDLTAQSDFHTVTSNYDGSNVATAFVIDGAAFWSEPPSSITFEELATREGDGSDGDNVLMVLDLR